MLYWFGNALIRVENERYFYFLHCNWNTLDLPIEKQKGACFPVVQTRTSGWANLFYALIDYD
jgi:hypothetical protein